MFYEQTRIKQGLSNISLCLLRIFYNRKFSLMATYLGTTAVVVTRVHCIKQIAHLGVRAKKIVYVIVVIEVQTPFSNCSRPI